VVCLLIQAKRLDLKSHKYTEIRRLVGKTKKLQIDVLTDRTHLKGIDFSFFDRSP